MTPSQILGANIRFQRKLKNLTQSELAEMLFMTPQSLSKWETGLANPDIWNLYRLSKIFGVSCNYLIGKAADESKKVMIAVDGGGSKTEFLMFDEDGEILGHAFGETSNPNVCGINGAYECIRNGILNLLAKNPNVSCAFLGIAGCGLPENRKSLKTALKQSFGNIEFDVDSDLCNVLYTCEPGEIYLSVICGTGSSIGIKNHEEISRIGGYGYLFDETFSGFYLGKEAIAKTLAYENGLTEETYLTKKVEKMLEGKALDRLGEIYDLGNKYIASFSKAVFEAYDMGDILATEIIEKSIKALSYQILHGLKSISPSRDVVLSGGLTSRSDIILPFLEKYCENVNFYFADMAQIYGAAVCAAKKQESATPAFKENLKKNYLKLIKEEQENA